MGHSLKQSKFKKSQFIWRLIPGELILIFQSCILFTNIFEFVLISKTMLCLSEALFWFFNYSFYYILGDVPGLSMALRTPWQTPRYSRLRSGPENIWFLLTWMSHGGLNATWKTTGLPRDPKFLQSTKFQKE